jgi:uracil-DNA glycosylase
MSTLLAVPTWQHILSAEKEKPYFQSIMAFLKKERAAGKEIYPAQADIFNAIKLTPFESVKVVIIGQDPYHGPHQAHGLSFSVRPGVALPPSLQNIFKELRADLGIAMPANGCLEKWATQGVLLLNAVLTVAANQPQSHAKIGWQQFTDCVISSLNEHPEGIVFLLWGAYAQQKAPLITNPKHHILTAPHPSPFSANRGFMGCKHFSNTNQILRSIGRSPVDWQLA